ncbi:hypothetical protein HIM_02848 [Hirsutella minnesotensis 3608]|nr:hypothetical protein HIM_02848 [Hirsutella minnesotensis 3608]
MPAQRRPSHGHAEANVILSESPGCCGGHHTHHDDDESDKEVAFIQIRDGDLEKGPGSEHVVLAVDGMTCSGCGNKMERTLKAISGVSAVRVNFVMGSAEFSLVTSVTSPDQVIRAAERATGFRCAKLSDDDQTIDVLSGGQSARALTESCIAGVNQASIISKKVVRITYDPTIIGARILMEKIGPLCRGLAPPHNDSGLSSGRRRLCDQFWKTLAAALFTVPVVVMAWSEKLVDDWTKAIVSLVLASVVQLIAVPDFYRPAISALIHSGSVEMDMLVVISITAAYVYSVVAFGFQIARKPLETGAFFETSTLLVTLVLLGRLVAAYARVRAVAAVSFRSLQSTKAVIVEDGQDSEVDCRLLQYGDTLTIGSHTVIPTDATILTGATEIDESMITGESLPVFKQGGDDIIAGTLNGSGTLTALLKRLPGRNTVTDIARLVEEAANAKPRLQDIADRVAGWFVPFVTSVALIVVAAWLVVGFKVRKYGAGHAISNAITYSVATLAVSCPCALGLAVPMVLVVAGGIAARNGVIIKSAECTEQARKVTDVVFDKTGTVTEAGLDVVEEKHFTDSQPEAIAITKALAAGNKHPVSLAVAKHLEQRHVADAELSDPQVIPGAGVEAIFQGTKVRAGNPQWTQTSNHPAIIQLQQRGMTLLVVSRDSEPLAAFGLRTSLRAEAASVVAKLRSRNIVVHLVSGDQQCAVETVAGQVGIRRFASQCTPADKRDYVARLMKRGRRVMFVGDGTNDAVAVTQADVGVQLASVHSASDVTRGAADVVLLNGLEGVDFLLRISAVSFRRIVFNFVWSATYNLLALLLASGALVNVRIPPAYAGLGELVSVLPVVLAAMTMLLKKNRP